MAAAVKCGAVGKKQLAPHGDVEGADFFEQLGRISDDEKMRLAWLWLVKKCAFETVGCMRDKKTGLTEALVEEMLSHVDAEDGLKTTLSRALAGVGGVGELTERQLEGG